MWTAISIEHVIHLPSDNTRVFLKPSTINKCKDLHNHTSTIPSIRRINVTAERAYLKSRKEQERLERVCAALATPKAKRSLSPLSATAPPPKRFHPVETMQVTVPSRPLSRSSTVIKRKTDVLSIHGSDSEDEDPEPCSSPLQRHTPSLVRTTDSDDDTPILFGRPKAAWPGARSVNEIVAGFSEIDRLSSLPEYTVTKAFEEYFNTRFPSTTFYEHRRRWNSASPTDRDTAQASNMTWASFAATHPATRAAEKAARKRRQRLLRQVTDSSEDREVDEGFVTDA